jgi:hypothetical protein
MNARKLLETTIIKHSLSVEEVPVLTKKVPRRVISRVTPHRDVHQHNPSVLLSNLSLI